VTLAKLLDLFRTNWRLMVIGPLITCLITCIYAWGFMPDVYTAEISIYALTRTDGESLSNETVTYYELNASQMLANDFAEFAKDEQTLENTAHTLGLKNLDGYTIDINSSPTTRIIKMDVTGQDPVVAASIANELTKQIGETAVRVMNIQAVNVINEARVPKVPSGPHRLRYAAISIPVGFLLAVAIVILRDILDTRVHSGSEIEEMLGVSVIGHVPVSKGR